MTSDVNDSRVQSLLTPVQSYSYLSLAEWAQIKVALGCGDVMTTATAVEANR
jgi:hypothetical protein